MKPVRVAFAVVCLVSSTGATAATQSPSDAPPLGFSATAAPEQARVEAVMLATPTPEQASKWLRRLTEEPHVAGTPADRGLAEMVRDRLREWGFEAELVAHPVLLNYPRAVSLALVEPAAVELSLVEGGDPRDKDSFSGDVFPGFHGYGASGTAEAQAVYANYGREEDFRRLEELGVEVAGRIVLVRYGEVFRGLKVKEAQQRGAAGVVIYSDPEDDGYMQGDVYPDGPMRPPYSLQRGSVQFLSVVPGDPQTPGWASTEGARRLPQDEIDEMARIPSLPLSYGEAEKVLRALAGERVPDDWQGGLPFAYHLGPGPAKLRMAVEMDYAVRPIWNVIATLRGSEEPDRWVVLGNHRDAWTYGAVDPNSGTAAMLETARALGEAYRAGWRPRRTLVLASWDGEEYGLLGSTEWGEQFADELGAKAVAYVNLDSAVTGTELSLSGIPSLRDLTLGVAGDLTDPKRGRTLRELWLEKRREEWADEGPIDLEDPDRAFRPALGALGSGSDYTVFVDHLGVASLNFTFSGKYGVYHSALDAFYWMQRFGDPEFLYHALAARFYGLLAMRLAGAELVPLRYVPYAEALEDQLDALRRRAVRERRKAAAGAGDGEAVGEPAPEAAPEASPETSAGEPAEAAEAVTPPAEGELAAAPAAPEEPAGGPSEAPPLDPDFAPVLAAVARFRAAAEGLDGALDAAGPLALDRRSRINDAVVAVERRLLDPAGLPGRPWFRHVLYAPGLTTGYAPWPFPGLAQAVKDHDAAMWRTQAATVVERLDAATAALGEAAALAR